MENRTNFKGLGISLTHDNRLDPRSAQLEKLRKYYDIFLSIVEDFRCTITSIAKNIGHTGRGRRRATISKYLNEMYQQTISIKPNLVMKTYDSPQRKVYLCSTITAESDSAIGRTFEKLKSEPKISYVVLGSGSCDFFLTSRNPSLDLEIYNLEILESSILYSPIYTIPTGWQRSFLDGAKNVLDFDLERGQLERKSKGTLDWDNLHMLIFKSMWRDARRPFTEVGRAAGVSSTTIKKHFYEKVLPCCKVAHYFFPNGYSFYQQTLFKFKTKYEASLVKAFKLLPCTTYVYPFRDSLAVNFFHDNINLLMTFMKKMEERRVIGRYTMFNPLWYEYY